MPPNAVQPGLSILLEFTRATEAGDAFAFRFTHQQYLLRSHTGSFQSATFPWDEALLSDLQTLRQPGKDPELRQRLGGLLRKFLADIGWAEQESQIRAALQAGRPVVVTIRSAAAELYALPWELVPLKATGQHLGELGGVLLRYEWPDTATAAASVPPTTGGHILVAWSAAMGAVPAAAHVSAVRHAMQAGGYSFDAQKDVLSNASLRRIRQALDAAVSANRPITALHLLCHGARTENAFGLALDNDAENEAYVVVDAERLRQVLAPYAGMVRLIVLSACDSGNPGKLGSRLGSIAQSLHRSGFATVLASRYPLSVAGSTQLTESLYERLLVGGVALESAVKAARQRLFEVPDHDDWLSMQLYARAADGDQTYPFGGRVDGKLRDLPARQPTEVTSDARQLVERSQRRAQQRQWLRWTPLLAALLIAFTALSTYIQDAYRRAHPPPRNQTSAHDGGQPEMAGSGRGPVPAPAACGALSIDDVLAKLVDRHSRVDIRLRNQGQTEVNVTRAVVQVLELHEGRTPYEPSAEYELLIAGPSSEVAVAHILRPQEIDRLILRVGFTKAYSAQELKATLSLRYNRDCMVTSDPFVLSSEIRQQLR